MAPVHYGRTCDLRNGDRAFVSEYPAVVNPPFTLVRPSRYLRGLTSLKVQNLRIAKQGSPSLSATEKPWKGYI